MVKGDTSPRGSKTFATSDKSWHLLMRWQPDNIDLDMWTLTWSVIGFQPSPKIDMVLVSPKT